MENYGFSSSATYKNLFSQVFDDAAIWKMIWRVPTPQKVHVFLWLLWHDRLLTNNERRRRHMTKDGFCPLCTASLETRIHPLRDCAFAMTVWRIVVPRQAHNIFFSLSIKERLVWNLQDKGSLHYEEMEWQTLFVILYWLLWNSRNECVFSNSHRNIGAIVDTGYMWARSYRDLDMQMKSLGTMMSLSSWTPPITGWIKLNSDGVVSNLE